MKRNHDKIKPMKTCSIQDCESKSYCRGWCRQHYGRWQRHGDPKTQVHSWGEDRVNHPLYLTYNSMLQRCRTSSNVAYPYYGGRGIAVCKRWVGVSGFTHFVQDMGERPKGMTLDRVDNNKDYAPENCRWATKQIQQLNRGVNKNNKSGYTGVFWHKATQKWWVYLRVEGKRLSLGLFTNKDEAILARKKAEEKYYKPILEGASL